MKTSYKLYCLVFIILIESTCFGYAEKFMILLSDSRVQNCTCPSSFDCNKFITDPTECTNCLPRDVSTFEKFATRARAEKRVLWWGVPYPTYVCCNNLATPTSKNLFGQLLKFTHIKDLTLVNCQDLNDEDQLTVYGLEKLTVYTGGSPLPEEVNITKSDNSPLSLNYLNYHIAVISRNIVTGSSPLKAWSVVRKTNENFSTSNPLVAALERSPAEILAKSDKTFMMTYFYL